jgi:subtilisin family serine protease
MRVRVRALTVLLLAGAGAPVLPAAARADAAPVSLVVGLRSDADVVSDLAEHVDVLHSEPLPGAVAVDVPANQVAAATAELRADPAVAYVEPDHVARIAVVTPDDPSYGSQWGIARTGVDRAWDTTRGARGVTVAVLDTGVRALPDLAPRLLPGYDFVNGDSDANDDNGHGTRSASVLAATGDNGVGVAGVCWSCTILPVKVLGANGSGSYSGIAQGIRYAADRGADIINMSLGGSADSRLLSDAVAYAVAKGALVVAAAGNDGSSALHYPAAIPSVLAVGASTAGDTRYSWSNHGSGWVDLAAPGCNPAQGPSGAVGTFCGTSSATPFAAGVAALIAAQTPAPDAAGIRRALTSSAATLAGGWVNAASGRVDAPAALDLWRTSVAGRSDTSPPVAGISYPAGAALVHGIVPVAGLATDDVRVTRVDLAAGGRLVGTDTAAPYSFRWDSRGQRGPVVLTLRAQDSAGRVTLVRRTVRVDNDAPAVAVLAGRPHGTRGVRRTLYVTARAADPSGISRMELVVDGRVTQRVAGALRQFPVQTWRHGPTLTVQVRAYDSAGNARTTPARTWYR